MLTCPDGYPTRAAWAPEGTGRVVAGVDDARAAVAERVAEGAAIVKVALNPAVGPVLDASTLTAICEAAHEHDLQVTGHIYGLGELHKALEAGIDELAHMLMSPERIPDETLSRMVENGVTVRSDPVDPGADVPNSLRSTTSNVSSPRAAPASTGPISGTKGPAPASMHPRSRPWQPQGWTDRSIVASATARAAKALGLTNVGVLEPGMQADIVGVNGNPLEDPRALADVRFVMRAGVVHRGPS